jgi:hypothetical protein
MGERMKKLTTASSQPSGAASYFTYVNLFARPTVGDLQRLKLTDVDRIWVVSLLGETVSEWTTNVKTLSEWVADIEQRQAKGHFKLNEAAQVLADENALDAGDLLLAMVRAVRAGRLAVRNPSTGLRKEPFKDVSFTELVFVEDIDEWLSLERVSYRFPLANVEPEPEPEPEPKPHVYRQRKQENDILAALVELDFDPLAIVSEPGKKIAAYWAVKAKLGFSDDVMRHAWKRLKTHERVKTQKPNL